MSFRWIILAPIQFVDSNNFWIIKVKVKGYVEGIKAYWKIWFDNCHIQKSGVFLIIFDSYFFTLSNSKTVITMLCFGRDAHNEGKVFVKLHYYIFGVGHKILRNLHLTFKILSASTYTEKNVLVQWEKIVWPQL